MKTNLRTRALAGAICLSALASSACLAMKKDVENAVQTTNAAMVATVAEHSAALVDQPPLDLPRSQQGDEWREPVAKLERIIAMNPDQTVLVNHLRVRQAMLLTVYQQQNHATLLWDAMDCDVVTSERDRALCTNGHGLVWAYTHALDPDPFLTEEDSRNARNHLAAFDRTLPAVENHDIAVYLGSVRAITALRLHKSADPRSAQDVAALHDGLASDLEAFVDLFTVDEQGWVQENATMAVADSLAVSEVRNRVFLRGLVREYRFVADQFAPVASDFNVDGGPPWRPPWVGTVSFD